MLPIELVFFKKLSSIFTASNEKTSIQSKSVPTKIKMLIIKGNCYNSDFFTATALLIKGSTSAS